MGNMRRLIAYVALMAGFAIALTVAPDHPTMRIAETSMVQYGPGFAVPGPDHPLRRPVVPPAATKSAVGHKTAPGVHPPVNPAYNGKTCRLCFGPAPAGPTSNGVPGVSESPDVAGWYSLPNGYDCTLTGSHEAAGSALVANPACASEDYRRAHGENLPPPPPVVP